MSDSPARRWAAMERLFLSRLLSFRNPSCRCAHIAKEGGAPLSPKPLEDAARRAEGILPEALSPAGTLFEGARLLLCRPRSTAHKHRSSAAGSEERSATANEPGPVLKFHAVTEKGPRIPVGRAGRGQMAQRGEIRRRPRGAPGEIENRPRLSYNQRVSPKSLIKRGPEAGRPYRRESTAGDAHRGRAFNLFGDKFPKRCFRRRHRPSSTQWTFARRPSPPRA